MKIRENFIIRYTRS